MKAVFISLVLFIQALNPHSKAVAPKSTPYVPTCADYRLWYEQGRQREYDTFRDPGYRLVDFEVTTWPEHRRLRADELMDLLGSHRKELSIDQISLGKGTERPLTLDELMYPQYFEKYTLSKKDWLELQRRAKANLVISGYADPDVIAHWKSIVAGNPPFGLKVRP